MTNDRQFVLVESGSMDRASLDLDLKNELSQGEGFLCSGCHALKPNTGDIGAVKIQGVIADSPFGRITGGLGIAHIEFLYSIGEEEVKKYFYVGDLMNRHGRIYDNWVSYHARHRYVVRGGKEHASYRYCEICGNLFYFALGKPYLYPEPPKDIDVFGDTGIEFFMTTDLAEKLERVIKEKKWRRVKFTKLPILDKPLDGLGEISIPYE